MQLSALRCQVPPQAEQVTFEPRAVSGEYFAKARNRLGFLRVQSGPRVLRCDMSTACKTA